MKNYVNKTSVCGSRPQWPTIIFIGQKPLCGQIPQII
jgi:hypothetical protein